LALTGQDRALQQAIYAAQDKAEADHVAAEAAQAQQRAAEEAKRAAEQLTAAWRFASTSIMDEVKRIRGLLDGGGAPSWARAQSEFSITTAQARAGDQEAAKLLPALSKVMLDLAQTNAVTAFDLQLARAQAASSLTQTASLLANKFNLKLPSYDVGTDYVPNTGLALIHEGERITPAAYNNPFTPPSIGVSDVANAALLAEVRALRAEVAALREANSRENFSIAKNTLNTADHLDSAVNGEVPLAVKVLV
jgi:hypothetical protein